MSTIELPITTKRSVRFKRFSWNQAGDGTFPPISAFKRAHALNYKVNSVSQPERGMSATSKMPTLHNGKHGGINANTSSTDSQSHRETNPALVRKPAADENTALLQKKSGKHFGKKRKGVYLGPSWDDEAGSLPTSANSGDMDFDALLLQMQLQQGDGNAPGASLKRKKVIEPAGEAPEPDAA